MNNKFHFLLFQSAAENVSVNALIKDETIWLTQKAMAQLFGVQTPAISKNLKKPSSTFDLLIKRIRFWY